LRAARPVPAKGRKLTSGIWDFVALVDKVGSTHICQFVNADGSMCDTLLTLHRNGMSWSTTVAITHFQKAHPASEIGKSASARDTASSTQKSIAMDIAACKPPSGNHSGSVFALTVAQKQLTGSARWYIYSSSCVSKTTFEDPLFRDMLQGYAQGPCSFVSVAALKQYVNAEFQTFLLFAGHIFHSA
jgi:hypothetical protein